MCYALVRKTKRNRSGGRVTRVDNLSSFVCTVFNREKAAEKRTEEKNFERSSLSHCHSLQIYSLPRRELQYKQTNKQKKNVFRKQFFFFYVYYIYILIYSRKSTTEYIYIYNLYERGAIGSFVIIIIIIIRIASDLPAAEDRKTKPLFVAKKRFREPETITSMFTSTGVYVRRTARVTRALERCGMKRQPRCRPTGSLYKGTVAACVRLLLPLFSSRHARRATKAAAAAAVHPTPHHSPVRGNRNSIGISIGRRTFRCRRLSPLGGRRRRRRFPPCAHHLCVPHRRRRRHTLQRARNAR